jgi:coenzyme F420 biosynthesis associated uncharacterized protein
VIDWKLVRRIAGSLAGEGPGTTFSDADLRPLARDAEERIVAYTGLAPRAALPAPELVSRHAWIDANITTMRPVFEELEERLRRSELGDGPLGRVTQATSGAILAAQLGGLMGYLSQRVLGQYDMPLLDAGGESRLLLVVPNLLATAERLEADRDDLLRWVTLHEVTHAVQFGSVPWLRGYLASGLRELLDSLELRVKGAPSLRVPSSAELREVVESVRSGEFVTLVIGRDRRALVDRLQGAMAVVEGHAEHVMDAVGAAIIPAQAELRTAMEARRATRSTPLRLLERLLGIELKMRQYREGKRFCDVVVQSGGIAALNRVWESERSLPTRAELLEPTRWISRMSSGAVVGGTR